MGYSGPYSLTARCLSECFATFTFVFFVLSLLANKLLPKTKGHDLSFGWLAFGVGIAVFIPVQFLGFISTSLNPAMALGSAIAGQIDWSDFPFIALSETVGAFLAAVAMYLYYFPQFYTVPEPPPRRDADRLLRTRDDIARRGLDFVSYSTREPLLSSRSEPNRVLQFGRQLRHRVVNRTPNGSLVYDAAEVLGPEAIVARKSRRRSVAVADLHRRLDRIAEANESSVKITPRCLSESPDVKSVDSELVEIRVQGLANGIKEDGGGSSSHVATSSASEVDGEELKMTKNDSCVFVNGGKEFSNGDQKHGSMGNVIRSTAPTNGSVANGLDRTGGRQQLLQEEEEDEERERLLNASSIADRNMKLAVFCTRPTTYVPVVNLFTEAMSTFFLVIGILFIKERAELLYEGYQDVYRHGIMAFYIGLLIFLLVLCLGGMGIAMNPARDFAPRLAHWLLPIDGKGGSEWYYAWIPIVGPLLGGAVAGHVFLVMKELNKGLKDGGYYDDDFDHLFNLTRSSLSDTVG